MALIDTLDTLFLIPRLGPLVAPLATLVTLTLHHPATLLRVLPQNVGATPALAVAVPLAWSAFVLWWLV